MSRDANHDRTASTAPAWRAVLVIAVIFGAVAGAAEWLLKPTSDLPSESTLAYFAGNAPAELVWVDRNGNEVPTGLEPLDFSAPRLSPDGTRLLDFLGNESGGNDAAIWTSDLSRNPPTLRIVTTDPGIEIFPFWLNDEEMVFYSVREDAENGLFRARADGNGTPELVVSGGAEPFLFPYAVTPGAQSFIFGFQNATLDLGILSLEGDPDERLLLGLASVESAAALAPNGEWLAYASNQSGEFEVYVRRFSDLGGLEQVSSGSGGGNYPTWSDDGSELFYVRESDGAVMAVAVDAGADFEAGAPELLIPGGRYMLGDGAVRRYEYDGRNQRFLMLRSSTDTTINVVENFFSVLDQRLPR